MWAEREERSALLAYVSIWMFMCDSSREAGEELAYHL